MNMAMNLKGSQDHPTLT